IDFGVPTPLVHLQSAFGNANGFLLPHHKEGSVKAWLLFGFYDAAQQVPDLDERCAAACRVAATDSPRRPPRTGKPDGPVARPGHTDAVVRQAAAGRLWRGSGLVAHSRSSAGQRAGTGGQLPLSAAGQKGRIPLVAGRSPASARRPWHAGGSSRALAGCHRGNPGHRARARKRGALPDSGRRLTRDDLPLHTGPEKEAFLRRIDELTPKSPTTTAEICLELPGREHAWWIWADRGVFDDSGKLIEIQAVGRDNTEIRRTRMQLNQSAKMATLGEMATGLAHEINQPLNVMRMAVVNVLKRLSNGDVEVDYLTDKLNRIDTQVQRAARVVNHMRVFGRRSEIEQQLFDPIDAVDGTLNMLSEGMKGKGVELKIDEPGPRVQVRGHVDQLEQVLINLMVNARDALLSKREKNHDFEPWIA
nr:hypothetical protein [Tanacetum cinerariifolium]